MAIIYLFFFLCVSPTFRNGSQRLVLRQNKIKTVDDTALRFYVELLYVDFSHNRYVSACIRTFLLTHPLQFKNVLFFNFYCTFV